MSRWPAIVVVSTVAPAGQRFDPRDTNEVVAPGVTSYCGASREPIYRSLIEASESGLEVCASCLIDARKPQPRKGP